MLIKCYNTKLKNVTVCVNTFCFSRKEGGCQRVQNCVVDRGPRMHHRASNPAYSLGNADCIHSSQARKGPTVTGAR